MKQPIGETKTKQQYHAFVGMDIAKATFAAAIVGADGAPQDLPPMANDAGGWRKLRALLHRQSFKGAVCMEPTSVYHLGVARFLNDAGYAVAMVSPKGAKNYGISIGKRDKTDAADAAAIALYGRCLSQCGKLRLWQKPSSEQRQLAATAKLLFIMRGRVLAGRVRLQTADAFEKPTLLRVLRLDEKECYRLRAELSALCRDTPVFAGTFARLRTIKGVGEHLAAVFLALGAHQCDSAKAAAAMHAFAPTQRQSGSSVHGSRLSFAGHKQLRMEMYMPALSAMRVNPSVSAMSERMRLRGVPGKKRVCACAHKLLRQMWGVANGDKSFAADHTAAIRS